MKLIAELHADAGSAKIFPAVFVGLAMGFVLVISVVSMSTLIFSGPTASFAIRGVGLPLFGTLVLCLTIALMSGYRGVVSAQQDAPLAVVIGIVAAAGASMADAASETQFMTLVVIVILTTAVAGACILLLGQIRIANAFRFIPYPVVGGYLAGAGWVLVLASFSIMSGVVPTWETLPRLVEPATLWKWLPGVAFAVALRLALARWNHFLVMPASFVLAAGLYHLGLALLGISGEEAGASGLLLSNMADHRLWPVFHMGELVHVDWRVVLQQTPSILIVAPVVLISMLMDLKGLQTASGVELDLDREFRAAGLANLVAALGGGGPPGYHTVTCSLPSRMFGAYSRLTGIIAALPVAAILFGGGAILEWFPVSLMGGLVFTIGFELLNGWLISSRVKRLSADYGVVLLVFLTVAVFGFPQGVAVGLIVVVLFLAINLGQVDVIKTVYTVREHRSSRMRPVSHQAILLDHADRMQVYQLHGYIFFGSVQALVDRLKEPLREEPPPLCMLLDCTGVAYFDISALDALGGFVAGADSAGTQVVIVAPASLLQTDLRRLLPEDMRRTNLLWEQDPDRGLERCEDMVIAESSRLADAGSESLLARMIDDTMRYLDKQVYFEELIERLRPWLEAREYAAGETLMTRGEKQNGMRLIVEGEVSVVAEDGARLHQRGPGDALSSAAAFGDHRALAGAIADRRCRVMLLTPVARRVLENDDPHLALELDRYVISSFPRLMSSAGREQNGGEGSQALPR